MYYSKFLEKIDFNLRQEKESGDSADAEHYRTLPRADTPEFVHDAVCELMRENPAKFTEEIVITLYDSGDDEYYPIRDGETFYVDMNEAVDGYILTIPEQIYELYKVMMPFGSSTRLGQWVALFGNTVSHNSIYCPSPRTIYNKDGWTSGDVFRVTAAIYPQKLQPSTTLAITGASDIDSTYTSFTVADNELERGNVIEVTASNAAYAGTYTIVHATQTSVIVELDSDGEVWGTGSLTNDYKNQVMPVPDAYIRLLLLLVKRNALARVDKPMNTFEYSELERRLYPQWRADNDIINTQKKIRFRGAGFGKRRSRS